MAIKTNITKSIKRKMFTCVYVVRNLFGLCKYVISLSLSLSVWSMIFIINMKHAIVTLIFSFSLWLTLSNYIGNARSWFTIFFPSSSSFEMWSACSIVHSIYNMYLITLYVDIQLDLFSNEKYFYHIVDNFSMCSAQTLNGMLKLTFTKWKWCNKNTRSLSHVSCT